jgi:uncharacterized membrane protein YphA (DoxX/SURF4 family)
MKFLYQIARIFVGVLFIFSGYVKLVDPIGFSYKLEEYFGADVLNLEFLQPFALAISVFVVIYELVLGVMLLLGYKPKFTVWSLLLMIVFFTFLTFYSAYFNKVTDCGCFGDAIPLDPWQSFYKDIILSVLIVFLFVKSEYLNPIVNASLALGVVVISLVVSGYISYLGINHLPIADFRPYKIGASIPENMEVPEGAQEAIYNYNWKFNINGEEKVMTTQGSYPDVDGELVSFETELVEEGYIPPIHDFSLTKNDENFIDYFMAEEKLLMIPAYDLALTKEKAWKALKPVIEEAETKGYSVIIVTSSGEKDQFKINEMVQKELDYYNTDETAIKTIVRSNPGLLVLNEGVIQQKAHWHDVEDIQL